MWAADCPCGHFKKAAGKDRLHHVTCRIGLQQL